MTVPLILCQNRMTGAKITIPTDIGYSKNIFENLDKLLHEEEGTYHEDNTTYYVHITESYRYCALLDEKKSDLRGKSQVIRYQPTDVIEFCSSIEKFSDENNREIIGYAHDIQYVIGTLIHRSVVNKSNADDSNILRANLQEINSVVGILSGKDAFFRFKTGAYREKKMPIKIHGEFLKMSKAFKKFSLTYEKKIKISLNSQNIPYIDTYEIFGFVPYLMIENAVKYAPRNSEVDVDLKIYNNQLIVTVGNMGPLLYSDEISRVFEREFRGENAIASGNKGQGLGLFHLKDALYDLEIGTVSLEQKNTQNVVDVDGVPYTWTELILTMRCNDC